MSAGLHLTMLVGMVWACLCSTLLALPCAQSADTGPVARGALIIAVDGLRADHLSCFGYDRQTTPRIDELARDALRYDNAYATAPAVLQSTASILTGCDPLICRRYLPPELPALMLTHWHLPERAPHIAHELLMRGWSTAAFLDEPLLGTSFGFARGFREFQSYDRTTSNAPDRFEPAAMFQRFEHWLAERGRSESWFAYIHISKLMRVWTESDPVSDAHFAPRPELDLTPPTSEAARVFFAIPRASWSGSLRTLGEYEAEYDGALYALDAAIGRLLDRLRTMGRFADTTVVLVGTRGVGFGEAGLYLDCGTLADVDLRVPLVIRPPRGQDALRGSVSSALVSTIDIAPTVLELSGAGAPSAMQGASLAATLRALDAPTRPFAFANSAYQEGRVVIGPEHCLEVSEPWRTLDASTTRSWYGGMMPKELTPRVVLHDRRTDTSLGHRGPSAHDPQREAEMRAADQRWREAVELLRRTLQGVSTGDLLPDGFK